jgi:hypothetical protein
MTSKFKTRERLHAIILIPDMQVKTNKTLLGTNLHTKIQVMFAHRSTIQWYRHLPGTSIYARLDKGA